VVAGVDSPPRGFEKDPATAQAVLLRIQSAHPDILLVGLGAPKQEYWIQDNSYALPCKLVMGVGGTFDLLSGQLRRAPKWVQTCGLEWLFRLCLEPRRLAARYLLGNLYFFKVVCKEFIALAFRSAKDIKFEVSR
jgi:N-acetylglucosaminyldiphosphoundecaprenol N-acetyl-beta-D-mannosaminyltransferase